MDELLKVLKELNTTFDKIVKPISDTIEKIEKLDENVKEASKNTVSYQKQLEDLKSGFNDIQNAATKTQKSLQGIGNQFKVLTNIVKSNFNYAIVSIEEKFKVLSNAIEPHLKKVKDNIGKYVGQSSDFVKKRLHDLAEDIKIRYFFITYDINQVFKQLATKIAPHLSKIKSRIANIAAIASIKFKKVTSSINNLANSIKTIYSRSIDFIENKFSALAEKVTPYIEKINKVAQKVAEGTAKVFGKLVSKVAPPVSATVKLLSGFIKAIPTPSIVADIVKTFTSGIAKIGGAVLGIAGKGLTSLTKTGLGAAKKAASAVKKVLTAPFKLIKNVVEKYGAFKKKYEEFQKKYTVPSLNFAGIKGKLKSAYDSVSKFVQKFGDKKKLADLNKLYKTEFSRITSVFKPVANKIISFATEFVKGFKAISKAAEPIISAIVNLAGTIGGFLRAMFGIKEGTSAAAGAINIFKKVLDFLVTPISYITLGLSTLFEVLKPAAPIIGAVAGAWLVWNVIMALSPITWIVLGIVALISVIAVVIKYTKGWATAWQGFKDILSAVWSQLKENFGFFIDSIVYGFQKAWYNVVDFGQRAIQYVKNVGAAIKLAWNGDFSGARDKLNEKITTEAEVKLKKIEEERQQRVQQFNQNTTANALKALNGARKMSSLSFDGKGLKADLKKMQKGFKFPDKAPAGATGGNTTTNKGITNITDGGKKQTHINIHFDRLVENMVIQSENLNEGVNDMEDKLITSLLRVLNSANQIQTTTA